MKIMKIHKGIKFHEEPWLEKYITFNTKLRMKAKNDFEKDFFKLMNNSVFGETMENLRNRIDVRPVASEDKARKLFEKPNYESRTIFSNNLIAGHMKKTKLKLNKPIYIGMSILDLSKTLMYGFHYNYIKPNYDNKAKLLFTDTDSLAYEIETKDFYKDIEVTHDVEVMFDASNYPKIHESGIPAGKNKKVLGMFKDEGGKQIDEFVGLRAKLYSYKMNDKEEKKCKGVKKNVIKKKICHKDFKDCLFSGKPQMRIMNVICHKKHDLFTEQVNKKALSTDDDKRVILEDKVNTLAIGHYRLRKV